jgi:hypothetical protein
MILLIETLEIVVYGLSTILGVIQNKNKKNKKNKSKNNSEKLIIQI